MARKDYVPDSFRNLRDWAENYLSRIDAIATRISWSPTALTTHKARLTRLRDSTQAVLDRLAEIDVAIGQLDQVRRTDLPEIRRDTSNLKTTSGFTHGDAEALQVISAADTFDADTYKPILEAEGKVGRIELNGKKLGVDSLNVYTRHEGETEWRLLVAKRVRFPFDDDTLPAPPLTTQLREYRAFGVVKDQEIGLPSDIVSAVFHY